jgi:hypothetical protein
MVCALAGAASCSTSSGRDSAALPTVAGTEVPRDTAQQTSTSAGPQSTVAGGAGSVGIAELAAAGIGVYADAGQPEPVVPIATTVPATPMRLVQQQLDAEELEVADGQGVLGADLDRVIGTEPGLPPPSFLVAGWISASGSPGAALARAMMGDRDWTTAPSILFPLLVLSLYSADAAQFADALAGPGTTPPTVTSNSEAPTDSEAPTPAGFVGAGAGGVAPIRVVVNVCAEVKGFVDKTVAAMFDALGHLQTPQVPSSGNNVLDFFGSGIQTGLDLAVGVVNGLIDAGRFLVVNGIKLAVQPILNEVAKVASALAVVATVTSLLRPWTIRMDAAPPSTRKSVGAEPGQAGTVSATVDLGGLDEWPPYVVGCAQTAGVTLPSLKPVGAPITWKVDQSPGDLAIEDPGRAEVLDANAHAELAYTTTQEDEETAKGDPATGTLTVRVSIRRKEIADFQQTISNLLFANIPSLIAPILTSLLGPTVNSVLAAIPAFLDSTARVPVIVTYHEETTTTTSAPPSSGCADDSSGIPSGTFTGDLAGAFQITEPPIPGQTNETFTGHVVVVSTGATVSGTLDMHWSGAGEINNSQVTEDTTLHDATLSGSTADPIVDGIITGQVVIDGAPSNSGSYPVHVHLHVLRADCQAITGDAIAMLREIIVAGQHVVLSGSSMWTATAA